MEKLKDADWFTESWAIDVQRRTRYLTCAYVEVCEAVERFPAPIKGVRLGGLGMTRRLFVVKSLLRDAVTGHLSTVMRHTTLLTLRSYRAARPFHEESWLGVRSTALPEALADARIRQAEFLEKQQRIAALLETAASDIEQLSSRLDSGEGGAKALKAIVRGIRRLAPSLWAAWVALTLSRLAQTDARQGLVFAVGMIIAYHALALTGLPFHDAGERKHALFGDSLGTPSDGLRAVDPPLARLERDLFALFGARAPIVMSWEDLVPALHYVTASALITYAAWRLPLQGSVKETVGISAAVLVVVYLRQLRLWWMLLRLRHSGRSAPEIALAIFSSIQALDFMDYGHHAEAGAPAVGAT